MLVGLRLNGIQYKNSIKIVEGTYIKAPQLIEKALFLLDRSGNKQQKVISNLKNKHKEFFILHEMFLKFTSRYRNRLAHGTIEKLNDQELINYLFHVDQSFYKAFENLLITEFGYSAFNTPSEWGAKQGQPQKIEDSIKNLNMGTIVAEPLQLPKVKIALSNTSYAKP